ncbi:MAG: hypothetical protein ACJAT7_001905 [Psychromonas sp.]|jgi:hypothetical protein|uniref:hypothetical protein n=1 Tax=Psychromonas sp. TaxID=1884585 RepID=UPI0039E5547F
MTIIGLSMACAYAGTTLMPPLIGLIATSTSFMMLPLTLLLFTALMLFTTQKLKQLG